eukprot:1061629-Rhodomonas_salina.1
MTWLPINLRPASLSTYDLATYDPMPCLPINLRPASLSHYALPPFHPTPYPGPFHCTSELTINL